MILQFDPAQYELSEMPIKTTHIESVYISDEKIHPAPQFINVWRRNDVTGQALVNTYKQTTKHGKTVLRIARAQRIQDALDAQGELPF